MRRRAVPRVKVEEVVLEAGRLVLDLALRVVLRVGVRLSFKKNRFFFASEKSKTKIENIVFASERKMVKKESVNPVKKV